MQLIDLFISFDGRIGRRAFWLGTAGVALALWAIERLATRAELAHGAEIIAFAGAFAIYPWAALAAKRATDRNRPRATGIAMVIGTVLLSLIAKAVSGGAPASVMGYLAAALWLVSLVDLGLMPSAPARPALHEDAAA